MKKLMLTALKEAGDILMYYFRNSLKINTKENQSSIVTQADVESEKRIMNLLQDAYPNHNYLGEESSFVNQNADYTWIVDPLDGTSNFASGIPWFGVLIALMKDKQPVLAGAFLPFYNDVYIAEINKGAYRNEERINVSFETELKNILFSYSLDYSDEPGKTDKETKIINKIVKNVRNVRTTNCLIDLCYTADGKLGGCMNQTMKIWDVVAPYLILKEAGARISDAQGRDYNFSVNSDNFQRNFSILAANPTIYKEIYNRIFI